MTFGSYVWVVGKSLCLNGKFKKGENRGKIRIFVQLQAAILNQGRNSKDIIFDKISAQRLIEYIATLDLAKACQPGHQS